MCGAILLALLSACLVLPCAAVRFANSKLEKMEGYTGKIESVGFCLASGKVTARDVVLRRIDENKAVGALRIKVEEIVVIFYWIQLARGFFLGNVAITRTL